MSHSASISYVNSDNLDHKAVTISLKEKCVKLWDIDVRYESQQDPRTIKQYKGESEQKVLYAGKELTSVAGAVHTISEKVFYALSNGEDIVLLDGDFNTITLFKDMFTPEYPITRLEFVQPNDDTLLLLFGSLNECRLNILNVSKYI